MKWEVFFFPLRHNELNICPPFLVRLRWPFGCTCGIQTSGRLAVSMRPLCRLHWCPNEGDMASATFQRGFAERITGTQLNWGLKPGARSDVLITTAGYCSFFSVLLHLNDCQNC